MNQRCTWPRCPRVPMRGPWCGRHDMYWRPHRWGRDHHSPEKVRRLSNMTEDELRHHCDKLRRDPMPVQGLYRLMSDLWKVDMTEREAA